MNKRWILILLAVCMLLTLCGCKTNTTNSDTTPVETESTESSTLPGGVVDNQEGGAADLDDDPTVPTDNVIDKPEETTAPTENVTEPTEEVTVPPETEANPTEPSTGGEETVLTDYERYHNMSGEEQKAFIDSFGSIEAFFEWYNAAKAEYEAQNPGIDVGDGNIDLGGGN